ncbi:hypothetical protein QTO34_016818 [Cnephaeus nilssonii]|uniref:Uncharacterized protein n=1 Tax=Cnephaeus nilssonii TaxID=3371016 RepID=A0AA40I3Z0_CNENI|nr:hypothetical protein QTO34_016818 [Eptesicus nilssonii]
MSEDQRASDLKRRRQLRQNVSEEQLLAKRHSEAERSRRHRQKMSKDQRASELERRRQCRQNMCKEQSLTSTANTDGVSRKFAQLYILDTAEATSKRLAMPENQDCSERLMININNLMHEINELTKSYKMLHEVEKEAQSEAAAKGSQLAAPEAPSVPQHSHGADAELVTLLATQLSVPPAQSATPATPSPAPPRLLANHGHSEGLVPPNCPTLLA